MEHLCNEIAALNVDSALEPQHGDIRADAVLNRLLAQYEKSHLPIEVDFRELVDWVAYGERASHMVHLYPAKLLPHIPALFTSSGILSKPGDIVLDPFTGSGTVLLEAILAGRQAIGADSNPLARLITAVKTTPIDRLKLQKAYLRLRTKISTTRMKGDPPDVVNINYWFLPHVIEQLTHIKECIDDVRHAHYRDFFRVAFSNVIKRVSLADPKLSVPVRLNKDKYPKSSAHYKNTLRTLQKLKSVDVYDEFHKLVNSNIRRISAYAAAVGSSVCQPSIYNDARTLSGDHTKVEDGTVQLIVTSPPYAGAQKYIRSSSLNMGWLEQCKSNELRHFEIQNIGREHYPKAEYAEFTPTGIPKADLKLEKIYKKNPLRAYIAANYIREMGEVFEKLFRVLRPGGFFVLVTSSNTICGSEFETHEYLCDLVLSLGFQVKLRLVDDIHSRGLMTKRNKTSGMISCEWVYVFQKDNR